MLTPDQARFPRLISMLGLVLLVLIAVLSYWSVRNFREAALWRRHSYVVIAEIRSVKAALETTKGALVTLYMYPLGPNFSNFTKSSDNLSQSSQRLQDLVSDNDLQSTRAKKIYAQLEDKLPQWHDYALSLFEASHRLPKDDLQRLLDQAATDDITTLINDMDSTENIILLRRAEKSERNFQITSIIVFIGLFLAFFMFFASNRLLQKEIQLRRRTELDLQEAKKKAIEASDLKSSFLANMSHEIRTPLNGIIGMTKLLEHTPLNERQGDYLETIKTSSNSLLSLINEILDLSKIESGKMQLEETNFELSSLLKSAVSIVDYSAKSKGLLIETDINSATPEFFLGDPLRLRQVLLNLLSNAIKFSDTGTIKVRVASNTVDDQHTTLHFEVIDQGVGFDSDTRTKLFQSFSQGDSSMSRRYGGTGLGLSISKQIVEMMHGKIDVESVKGVGSKFYFDVKLAVPSQNRPTQKISDIKNIPLRGNVLVAEDNLVNQKVASEMLALMGCTSVVVDNGAEAIEALRKEDFDIVLMDAQMPVMNGYEATRLIRRGDAGTFNKNIPILAATANAIKGDIEQCLEVGMNDYISKPITYNDLVFKIEKWMKRGHNIIDQEYIQRLHEQGDKAARPFLKDLVEIFSQDGPEILEKMQTALELKKFDDLSLLAHNLKTSAAIFGAHRLRELAERIEHSKASDVDEQQMSSLLETLGKELHLVIEALAKEITIIPPTAKPPFETSP